MTIPNSYTEELYNAVLKLESRDECERFFEDICTVKEIIEISQRLKVARMLNEGKSYIEIANVTGASTATICRVNRCYMYGSGGYKEIISKIAEEGSDDEN